METKKPRYIPGPPQMTNSKPLICIYGLSGSGKTMSALLLGRGIAGPNGHLVGADSERGRMDIFKDSIPGGFTSFRFEDTSPSGYCDVIDSLEASGADCGVIDSCSHEWEGNSGVLEQAAANEEKSGRPGLHNWVKPKMAHKAFILRLLRCSIPLIITLRAKFRTTQGKNEQGKTVIIESDRPVPITSDDLIYECLVHGEVMPDHTFRLTKELPKNFANVIPNGVMLTEHHGSAIMAFLNGKKTTQPASKPSNEIVALKKELWSLMAMIHNGDRNRLQQFLWDETILDPELTLEELSVEQLKEVITKTKTKI